METSGPNQYIKSLHHERGFQNQGKINTNVETYMKIEQKISKESITTFLKEVDIHAFTIEMHAQDISLIYF